MARESSVLSYERLIKIGDLDFCGKRVLLVGGALVVWAPNVHGVLESLKQERQKTSVCPRLRSRKGMDQTMPSAA